MTLFVATVTWVTVVGYVVAAIVCARAAGWSATSSGRVMFGVRAFLAVVTSLLYLYLIIFPDHLVGWTTIARSVFLVNLALVWILPAHIVNRDRNRSHTERSGHDLAASIREALNK